MRDWIVSKYHLQQDLEKWDIFLFKISLFITYSYCKSLWFDWFILLADFRKDGTYSRRTSASWPHCSSTPKIHNSSWGSQEVCRYPAPPACIAESLLLCLLAISNVQMLLLQLQETASPEESFLHLSETAVVHVQVLVDFTKRLPGEFLPLGNIKGTKSNWWHEPEKNTGFKKRL